MKEYEREMYWFDLSNPYIRNEKTLNNIRKYIEDNPLVERIRFEEFYRNGSDTRLTADGNPTPTRISGLRENPQ